MDFYSFFTEHYWATIVTITSSMTTLGVIVYNWVRGSNAAKNDNFNAILAESRKFRDEMKEELTNAKQEVSKLKQEIKDYESKIRHLNELLTKALLPKSWIYYYFQKPICENDLKDVLAKHTSTGDKILLLTDDTNVIYKVIDICEDFKVDLHHSGNGNKAVEAIKIQYPKVVIIDLTLPVLDTFELLNYLHENAELINIPLLVINNKYMSPVERNEIHATMLA